MLGSPAVPRGRFSTAARVGSAAVLLALSSVPMFTGRAAGEESLSDLRARMSSLQAQLDAATRKISSLEARHHELEHSMSDAERKIEEIKERNERLEKAAVKRANILYRSGGTGMVDVLFGASDFGELSDRAEILSQISLNDADVFVELNRSKAELSRLVGDLAAQDEELKATNAALREAGGDLQSEFQAVSGEYQALQEELTAVAPAAAPAVASQPSAPVRLSGGMACPVNGPVSFVDSWGAPRSGHTHQGVDMMAGYGTPVVAITSGTITLSSYGGSAGYWQILSGDDGNAYWYMHNQSNIINGGHVSSGQQIATVGDTGNAEGTPHLHFEFHPGGGSAVNPTPLVSSLC